MSGWEKHRYGSISGVCSRLHLCYWRGVILYVVFVSSREEETPPCDKRMEKEEVGWWMSNGKLALHNDMFKKK